MWKWHKNLNLEANINKNLVDHFKKHAKIGGTLFVLLGAVGILFPAFMSLTTVLLVGYLMLFAGVSAGILTYKSNREDWTGWLKSFILVLASFLILFYPLQGGCSSWTCICRLLFHRCLCRFFPGPFAQTRKNMVGMVFQCPYIFGSGCLVCSRLADKLSFFNWNPCWYQSFVRWRCTAAWRCFCTRYR